MSQKAKLTKNDKQFVFIGNKRGEMDYFEEIKRKLAEGPVTLKCGFPHTLTAVILAFAFKDEFKATFKMEKYTSKDGKERMGKGCYIDL